MTRCNTLLCGNEAVWQRMQDPAVGKPYHIYKCDLCYDKNRLEFQEGWIRIVEAPVVLASRIRSYRNQNV